MTRTILILLGCLFASDPFAQTFGHELVGSKRMELVIPAAAQ